MTTQPPQGPPPPPPLAGQPPPQDDHYRKRAAPWWRSTTGLALAAGLIVALAAVAIVLVFLGKGSSTSSPTGRGEIFLDAAASAGRNPFTASVMLPTPMPSATAAAPVTPPPPTSTGAQVINATAGSTPGLYGGTRQVAACDKRKLIDFLTTNPDKGAAWAQVQGITPAEIPAYITGLTAVILRGDTRVTNHGFINGQATTYQDVLQAGTGVLVDQFGVPRARCYCGNPLTPPVPTQVTPTYTGTPWPGFSPTTVVVIQPAPQPITIIVIVDVFTGQPFGRPVGGDGTTDTNAPGFSTPTPAPTPSPCVNPPASADARPCDITALGTATASSTFSSGQFPVSNAVDGSRATSWFSAGRATDGENSTFAWTAKAPVVIGSVSILNNSQNSDSSVHTGETFLSVTVQLKDQSGAVVASMDAPMNDRDVTVNFGGVTALVVNLVLHHHTDPACGGFSELIVRGVSSG